MLKTVTTLSIIVLAGAVHAVTTSVVPPQNDSVSTNNTSQYAAFQDFDNQYNIGYGVTSGYLSNGTSGAYSSSQYMNIDVEHLFDNGVWFDVNANLLTNYSQPVDPAVAAMGNASGSTPNFGGINANVGYAFTLVPKHLLITPYGTLGRNTNLSAFTLENAGVNTNITNDYFWTFGAGARLDYRINNRFDIYLDQNFAYNDSKAPIDLDGIPQNDYFLYTTTLGSKWNVYKDLQLGAKIFYSHSQFTNDLIGTNGIAALVPQDTIGALLSIGLTY